RYCTLFWPKYCAWAAPATSSSPASAHATRFSALRRTFILRVLSLRERSSWRLLPLYTDAPRPVLDAGKSPASRSILPACLQVQVVVRVRLRRRHQRASPARHAARQVDEPVHPVFGLHVLLEQVAGVEPRRVHALLVLASHALAVPEREPVRDLGAHDHDDRPLAGHEIALVALQLPVGERALEVLRKPCRELGIELAREVIVERVAQRASADAAALVADAPQREPVQD